MKNSAILGYVDKNNPIGLKLMVLRGLTGTVTLMMLFASFR